MSSQNDTGIPLVHDPDGKGYRFLTLESSTNSAILKSGSQSWGLRQKNTSNALILLKPTTTRASTTEMPETGLKAVATVHDTIELVPESSSAPAPVARGKWHEKFARGR
ncbi:hypothetical protein SLS62_001189 [Diatrype stigma]|uniref:Uncharacterized protein n=1 Tax=Diatrype stigma TaxID=117547 RepID=A0AAN9UZG1_9PEZI